MHACSTAPSVTRYPASLVFLSPPLSYRALAVEFENHLHISKDIQESIIDIVVVACHYSNRFDIDEFCSKCNNSLKKCITKFDDVNSIITSFTSRYLSRFDGACISKKDIFLIWSLFLNEELLPFIFNEKKLCQQLSKIYHLSPDSKYFMNIKSSALDEIRLFIEFVNESFINTYNMEHNREEFEIDEILNIFSTTKSININHLNNDIAVKTINYYSLNLNMSGQKLYSISCIYWNKEKEVMDFIKMYIDNNHEIKSAYDAYQLYTSKSYQFKVNKSYFERLYEETIYG